MPESEIAILVADDHAVVRRGLKEIIREQLEGTIVFYDAASAAETIAVLRENRIDLVLLDISLPDNNGLELLKTIKAEYPGLAVLVISIYGEDQFALRAFQAGAAGYLTKDSAPDDLYGAVKKILDGDRYLSHAFCELLLASADGTPETAKPLHSLLSVREWQVARMLTAGTPIKSISALLELSEKTISTYRTRILEKLQIRSNAELVSYFIYHKLT